MVQQDDERSRLVRLDDFEGELEETWQEAKGLKVFDKSGDEVGTVEDLYIYEDAEAVHLIKVEVEGSHVLIPVDAARSASEDGVELEQDKGTIAASPEHHSNDVPDSETSRKAYEHFGYPDQLALG